MISPARELTLLATLLGTTVWPISARANDACTPDGSTTVTCSGDQSGGILYSAADGISTLIIEELTEDIAPDSSDAAVSIASDNDSKTVRLDYNGYNPETDQTPILEAQGDGLLSWSRAASAADETGKHGDHAGDTIVNFVTGNGNILGKPAGEEQVGSLVRALSEGGDGGSGKKDYERTGMDGGYGGNGGATTVRALSGTLAATINRGEYGVFAAESYGGDGGAGGKNITDTNDDSAGGGGDGGSGGAAALSVGNKITAQSDWGGSLARVTSTGGKGGVGGYMYGASSSVDAGYGGNGGDGGTAGLTLNGGTYDQYGAALGFQVQSIGGDGGDGGLVETGFATGRGGLGGDGGAGGSVRSALNAGTIDISDNGQSAILLQSLGGDGGAGGVSNVVPGGESRAGAGGAGGDSGSVDFTSDDGGLTITNTSSFAGSHGIHFSSIAGQGGTGGEAKGAVDKAFGGDGGKGGTAGHVEGGLNATITTAADQGQGVFLQSYGGAGGDGGKASGGVFGEGTGGAGAGSGPAGYTVLTFNGEITTSGNEANAILSQSVGGFSGDAGDASGFVAYGAGSQSAGAGGLAEVTLDDGTNLTTSGDYASAVLVQSVGGGGGRGSKADGVVALGGSGSAGGDGAAATLTIGAESKLTTTGAYSAVASVTSVGGGGGDAGASTGVVAMGGSSGTGGNGGTVTAKNLGSLISSGDQSDGLVALSVGGGGGSAHSTVGFDSIGGKGGSGGDGGFVTGDSSGDIETDGDDSDGIFLSSIGGGGGSGSSAYSASALVSVAIGGTGGSGGKAGGVVYDDAGASGYTVTTKGDRARGLTALSVGGGGGDGGTAVSISAGPGFSLAIAKSGSGHGGGDGGAVSVTTGGAFSTEGDNAAAIHAHSVGGGGGNAGNTISASVSDGLSATVSIGGDAGAGGMGGGVIVDTTGSTGALSTHGDNSAALVAESTGGGGGHSGTTVGGSLGGVVTLGGAIGGKGGSGSAGGKVAVAGTSTASISTQGDNSAGVYAHSIGGGGGFSGTTADGSGISGVAVNSAVGGSGGAGGTGGAVNVALTRDITTKGHISAGIAAMSIGGGGGHSGITASGTAVSSVAVDVSVGGSGGAGANSGVVGVLSRGAISTFGHSSAAVSAQSIAGGGGASHFTGAFSGASQTGSINAAIGGKGGSGGTSGDVSAGIDGDLTTSGHNSPGVSIMSIGGGGGESGTTVAASGISKVAVNVAIGGGGGDGGNSGAVTLNTGSDIVTFGDMSVGLNAKSIAGQGGTSGIVADVSGVSTGNIGVSIGGGGGNAGTSGIATVKSLGSISTSGAYSSGIVAQSIAGQGGSAKGSFSASLLSKGQVSVTVGGSGGDGGTAGDVTVDSSGTISTLGTHSYGILAQSHGGSGGDGGLAAEAGLTAGEVSGQLGVTVGGGGGKGGTSGDVSVSTYSENQTISTDDFGSHGIFALTTGGDGGTGGSVYTGNLDATGEKSANVNISVGGGGGDGGKAGSATVTNLNAITTGSFLANGIFASSIGGTGGDGGSTYSVVGSIKGSPQANISVSVGGSGGDGAIGGAASITNSGAITTENGGSTGLFVQSIGGGGGRGGSSANLNLTLLSGADGGAPTASISKASINAGIAVGGSGGTGNHAGVVTLTNQGAVLTKGAGADALFAQSIGGGGGDGGTASTTSISVQELACTASKDLGLYVCKGEDGEEEAEVEAKLNVAIGGSSGAGGDGGTVNVTNTAALTTEGDVSHGIVAQSIGGGGGTGGDGGLGLDAWTSNKQVLAIETDIDDRTELPSYSSMSVAVGGSGGAAGNGETVTVTNSGAIQTSGDHSFGIHAQSIGGGGGKGGAGAGTFWTNATVGGKGGDAYKTGVSDGGDVNITLNAGGSIATSGLGSVGLLAQSVGGGGGIAGDVDDGIGTDWDGLHVGYGLAASGADGAGGDGGDLTIAINDTITTTGDKAHGVYLQSVGGGGGVLGATAAADADIVNYVGNNGNDGSSGDITATLNSAVLVEGDTSVALFAQSVAGAGSTDTSGKVTIKVDTGGSIRASGAEGRAILAQSVSGDGTNNTIAITIEDGAEVSSANDGYETIALLDGKNNTIINHGTLIQDDVNTAGYVVRTNGEAALSITNYGTLGGAMYSQLSSGASGTAQAITIANQAGGTFGLGRHSDLAGGEITNNGSLSAGDFGVVAQIGVDGTITQSATGTTQVDIAFGEANDLIDIVDATSTSTFAGTITPKIISGLPTSGQSGALEIIESAGTLISTDLKAISSATVDYSLGRSISAGNQVVQLGYKVDVTPWDGDAEAQSKVSGSLRSRINANHDNVGRNVDDIMETQQTAAAGSVADSSVDPDFAQDLALVLFNTEKVEDLIDIYDGYAPAEIFAPVSSARFSSLRFSNDLNSCPGISEEGVAQYNAQGACYWGRIGGTSIDRQRDGMSIDYDETVFGISGGVQTEIADGWYAGAALSYERSDLSNDQVSGDGDRFQLGAVLKREIGATTLSGSLSGGYSNYDLSRKVTTLDGTKTAKSDPRTTWITAHARAAHRFDISTSSYIKPWVDLGVQYTHQDGYTETGAGDFGLVVDGMSDTFVTLNPMVEFGTDFSLNGLSARANFNIGALAVIGGNKQSTEVRFIGAGDNGPGFTIANEGDDLFADLSAGLVAQVNERTTIRASFGALLSDNQQEYSAGLRLNIAF